MKIPIYLDSFKKTNIDFYVYVNSKWQKLGGCKRNDLNVDKDFKSNLTQFGPGLNYDDIFLTKFEKKVVTGSEYYLYSALSDKSGIKDVLSTYKKEYLY